MIPPDSAPLIVHTDWSRSWGGQEIRTLTELREMSRLGFRPCLMVPEDSELARRGRAEGIAVHPTEYTSKFHPSAWKNVIHGLRSLRPAVVNTHSSEDSWMAGAAARLCRVTLVVRTRHVLSPISSAVSYNLFPHVILACSESIAAGLADQGVSRKKIVVQPTGIDGKRFCFSRDSRSAVRQQYGVQEDEVLVGNVGFLRVYKGQIFIVRTAALMPDNYKFMLVGDGQDMPLLREEARKLGVENRFIFAGHQERPEDFFSAFDILFFSSWETEGIAQSFVQGLLYGLPLLVCRTPSILEPLSCVHNYRVIDYDDREAARSGLLSLAENLTRDEEAVGRQREALAAKYGLRSMMDNLLDVYARHGIHPGS